MPKSLLCLNKLADVQVGYQSRNRIEESPNGSFRIIRPQDLDDKSMMPDVSVHFFPEESIDPSKYLVKKDDILIQARGNNHFAILISQDYIQTVASNSFYIIKNINRKKILPGYLSWWLNQPEVQNYFLTEQGLSTIPFISIRTLQNTLIRVPSLETQEKICNLIDLWNHEQVLSEQILGKKEILIQTLANKTVQISTEEK